MRQPGADDDQRRAALAQLVTCGAQRRHVVGAEVLHLVEKQRDTRPDIGCHGGRVDEQLGQVDFHVA